jgi:hypothetical protein
MIIECARAGIILFVTYNYNWTDGRVRGEKSTLTYNKSGTVLDKERTQKQKTHEKTDKYNMRGGRHSQRIGARGVPIGHDGSDGTQLETEKEMEDGEEVGEDEEVEDAEEVQTNKRVGREQSDSESTWAANAATLCENIEIGTKVTIASSRVSGPSAGTINTQTTNPDEFSQLTEGTQGSFSINWLKAGANAFGKRSILVQTLRGYVKSTMFRRVKFIDWDDPKLTNSLVPECFAYLGLNDETGRLRLGATIKRNIMYSISQQRNRAAQSVGKTVIAGKYKKWRNEIAQKVTNTFIETPTPTSDINSVPAIADLLLIRQQPYDEAPERVRCAFRWMADNILHDVAGRKRWNGQVKTKDLLRSAVTVSDEAFAILLLDNNMDRWRNQVDKENENMDDQAAQSKYTASGRMWSRVGMARFVEYYKIVSAGRVADKSREKTWDCTMREYWKSEEEKDQPKNRRRGPMFEPSFLDMPIDDYEEV